MGIPFRAAFLAAAIAAFEVTKTPNLLLLLNFLTILSPSSSTVGALNRGPKSKSTGGNACVGCGKRTEKGNRKKVV